jgi:hypothetical protein
MRLPVIALIALLSAGAAGAAGFSGITPRFGVIYEVAPSLPDLSDTTKFVGGPPLLTYFLGIGVPFEINSFFSWEPALDIYLGDYQWSEGYARALATDNAYRESFTLAFLVQSPFVFELPIGLDWNLGLGVGPAFNFRLALIASLTAAETITYAPNVAKIGAYFYSAGRWFMPETFFRVTYRLTQRVNFAFSAIAFWPFFDLWVNPALALDEGIFGGELRVRVAF